MRAAILGQIVFNGRSRAFSTLGGIWKKAIPPSLSEINVVDLERYAKYPSPPEELAKELKEFYEEDLARSEKGLSASTSLIKAFLYGSPEAQREAAQFDRTVSQSLMRNTLVHEISFHSVIPSKAPQYVQLMTDYNTKFKTTELDRLVGAWRAVIGSDVDTYVHIWEYDNLASLHKAKQQAHSDKNFLQFSSELTQYLRDRTCEVVQEFSFWGGTPKPRSLGGIFELRKYDLKPGTLVDWESYWRKGLESRREVMEPVGAWYVRIGPLNRVYHLWQFTDLQHRKISRVRSWALPGWAETTADTVKLLNKMESMVLLPLDYSPLK